MMFQSLLLGVMGFTMLAAAAPLNPYGLCGVPAVSVRLPPAFDNGASSAGWKPFSPDWYFKPWNMVYTSNPANLALRNFQYDPTPVDPSNPAGAVHDLGSFQIPNNATIHTTYGVDTPDGTYSNVYNYVGTGILTGAYSEYSLLAWGCDERNRPYYVNYATYTELTKTPAGIDVMSTSDMGMDDRTLAEIVRKLKALGNKEIADMAGVMKKTTQDGARRGLPRVDKCDDECKSNQNLVDILG